MRRRHDIGKRNGVRMRPACDKTGKIRHIDKENRSAFVGNLAKLSEIKLVRIRRMPGDQKLRSMFQSKTADLIVIEQPRIRIEIVMHGVESFTRNAGL